MTKTILIYILGILLLISCSTNNESGENRSIKNILPSDTTIIIETAKQKLKLVIDKNGAIHSIEINPETNSQTLYYNSDGLLDVAAIWKGKREEHSIWLNSKGQVLKIKSYDLTDTCGGDQFIWFANSNSKSLLIDYDKTHVPLVCGLKDTFKINTTNVLIFKTINNNSDNATIELKELHYDTSSLTINVDKKFPNKLIINSRKKGTFQITGEASTSFLKHKPIYGILNRLDFNLIFD